VRSILACLALAAVVAGCGGGGAPWPPVPAEVRYGEDACASCRMPVSDPRHAAQVVDREGRARFYDDLGCLIDDRAIAHPEPQGVLVRPYAGEGWVRGDAGWTVRSGDFQSPMGSGIAAFPTRETAEAEARRHPGASVRSLADLLASEPAPGPAPPRSVGTR
jgi:copper chaperone NosL